MSDQGFVDLKVLNNKIDELINRYNELKTESENLRSLNEEMKMELRERETEMKELENKYDRVKLTGAILGDEENSIEAKRKINDLMREIDKCIALLER
jgi:chromosome segregation ATPase